MRLKIFLLACLVAEIYSDDREEKSQVLGIQPSIIGGQNAHPGHFPYLVSILKHAAHNGGHTHLHACGGAIIDARWILTAAHCYDHGETLIVKAGKHDNSQKETHEQVFEVKTVIINKHFDSKSMTNDIALLLLEHPLTLNQHVAKIHLPAKDSEPAGHGILSGWGDTSPHEDAKHSAIMQTVTMPILDRPTCHKLAKVFEYTLVDSQFCAKGSPPGVGGCSGDSGGPIVIEKAGGHKEVAGIFSWGVFPCGRKDSLDVFTRVSVFINWIHLTMDKHK